MSTVPSNAPAIIMVRPQMPENVGAAARAMLNFGVTDLRVVTPDFGWPNAKTVAAASGAHAVMNQIRFFPSVAEACADIHHLYATTARPRELIKPVLGPVEACQEMCTQQRQGHRTAFLFGPERTGLDNDELVLADAILTVPLNPEFSSLNLSQAVLLCVFQWHQEWHQQHQEMVTSPPETLAEWSPADPPATKIQVQGMLDHLFCELDAVGFFRSDSRRKSLTRTVGTMFERRWLTAPEVHLMRGMIKELRHGPFGRKPK